ncbi:concanavalin A-like lectin/glucanase [Aspergillus brunneoviolaceus CBS 621.78]|uniref:Concanavalin A-like lectin/glucanase n=1 Tax=Aspergillus brunneoviolaceus CBS 621.78 TaxID=1450534 RepID=A0ACD1G4J0_9EURO|nr:concanavalin A-like lectin/glucanase [Aspergillus brunneoviolaceus CBS 621.78]RAH44074.1 concanavalin A-like lectin/glucanase [Aspergillus brunneoviolaceus CBS 621.78]
MKLTTSLAVSALLAAGTALAAPHEARQQRRQFGSGVPDGDGAAAAVNGFTSGGRNQGQGQGQGQGHTDCNSSSHQQQPTQTAAPTSYHYTNPSVAAPTTTASVDHRASTSTATNYQINENWAGAVLESAPASSATYTYVAATFTLPAVTPTAAASSADTQAVSFWVGIDGATAGNSIWQTGVDIYVDSRNETSFAAWYEWYPANSVDVEMDFAIGDVVFASVEATSSTAGTAVIENRTTGKKLTMHATAPSDSAKLEGQNAEWIVEDLAVDGDGLTLVGFEDAVFTGCVAETADGESYGLEDGAALYAVQDTYSSSVQAVPEIVSGEKLVVRYQ